jgi:hypothetical protein
MGVKTVRVSQSSMYAPIQVLQLGTVQKVAVAVASAATTNVIAAATEVIRVAVSTDCYMAFGTTATVSDHFLPAGTVEYFKMPVAGTKLAFIRNTADGVATVTECANE